MSLHDELQRIADRAPVASVPDDLYARGRRARVRDRVLVVAAAAAVVALVAGLVAWLPARTDPPIADTDALGVPDRLWAPPERMGDRENDGAWLRDEVTDDPTAVGVGAAAWVTGQGLPVVVDAREGDYHLLDLPDFAGNNENFARGLGEPVVALSPDGTRLAYGYAVFGPTSATDPIPSGVRVVDLTTGDLREIPVPGEEGTAVSRIGWSPDGRWLAFAGMQQGTWTAESMGTPAGDPAGPVLGRIPPGATAAEVRAIGDDEVALRIANDGVVTFEHGGLRRWDGDRTTLVAEDRDPGLDRWLGRTADGAPVRLAANVAAEAQAVETTPGAVEIVLDPSLARTLSLATDLMTLERPTVHRPEPGWPASDERRVVIALALTAAAALLLALARLALRRRPPR